MKKSETLNNLIASKVNDAVKLAITKDCEAQDRSESYVIRKIVEKYYADKIGKPVKKEKPKFTSDTSSSIETHSMNL